MKGAGEGGREGGGSGEVGEAGDQDRTQGVTGQMESTAPWGG